MRNTHYINTVNNKNYKNSNRAIQHVKTGPEPGAFHDVYVWILICVKTFTCVQ